MRFSLLRLLAVLSFTLAATVMGDLEVVEVDPLISIVMSRLLTMTLAGPSDKASRRLRTWTRDDRIRLYRHRQRFILDILDGHDGGHKPKPNDSDQPRSHLLSTERLG